MAETGSPQAAVERGNKRKIHQHFIAASFLATGQQETDLQASGSRGPYVENAADSGIFYLNPLTPKWNCGVSERSLEISSEEDEDGIWGENEDNDARRFVEKAKTSKQVIPKLLKLKKHHLVPQTFNGNSTEHHTDSSSASSDNIGFQSQDNGEGQIAGKRTFKEVKPKLKLLKVQKHNLKQQPPMDKCSDIVSSQSEEKDIRFRSNNGAMNLEGNRATSKIKLQKIVQPLSNGISRNMENCSDILEGPEMERKDDTEETFARTSKQVTPTPKLIVQLCTNPQTKQCTSGGHVDNEVLPSEGQEKDQESQEHIKDKKLPENDIQVTSKLKELQVKENQLDGAQASANLKGKDDSKISRLLEAMKKRSDMDAEERPFKCPHCHWAFKKLCYLQSHVTTHSGLKPHVCDICGKAYSHQGTLQQHKRLHTGERPYRCPFCERSYIWSSDYRKHIRTHTGEKPYECKECGKDFIRSSDLRKHERNMHTNNKPFPCSLCDKTFNRPLSLKRHERKHLGERPYSCSDCGKKFALASRMAEHQKIHKGVRPFVCSVCAKSFTKSSNLAEHEAIHSGVRPYRCEECGVAFAMASRLVRHQYVHNKGKPHSCAGCGRNYSCLASLEQHQQLNCAGRIFICVQCDKSFVCADKLTQHMQHHNDKTGPN